MSEQAAVPTPPAHRSELGNWAIAIWNPHGISSRVAVGLAILASWWIFSTGSSWLGVPPLVGFDGSLLREPSPVGAIIGVAVLLAISTVLGTILAGSIRFEAGLLAAAVGLAAVSFRAGNIQSVLFEVEGSSTVYWGMALEMALLGGMLCGIWAVLSQLRIPVHPATAPAAPPAKSPGDSKSAGPFYSENTTNYVALAIQSIITALLMIILCRAEAKQQVLASVFISAWIGAAVAQSAFPVRSSFWLWIGPVAVGVFGYIFAGFGLLRGLEIGHPEGAFGALARALPLDYASMGTAGAILGYWLSGGGSQNSSPAKDETQS
jgi:hypothetical protein